MFRPERARDRPRRRLLVGEAAQAPRPCFGESH
jgi:hypothetical protein